MTSLSTPLAFQAKRAGSAAAQPRAREECRGRLRLRVSRPAKGTAVVKANGEIDLGTAPRLWEMLSERLHGHGARLIVDLSELDFFGVAGFRVLERAQLLAEETGTLFFVLPGECRSARRLLDLYDEDGLRTF